MISVFLLSQIILIPILGGIWLGIRRERQKQQFIFRALIERQRMGRRMR